MLTDTATYLGPARVIEATGSRLRLALADHAVDAVSALAVPYEPAANDLVLAIGQGTEYFVIGVLDGAGKTSFTVPGNLELRAPAGTISMLAGKGIKLASDKVGVQANELNLSAKCVTEKYDEAYRTVRDTFQIRAGELRERVKGKLTVSADRISQIAERDVHIDGTRIDLG